MTLRWATYLRAGDVRFEHGEFAANTIRCFRKHPRAGTQP